MDSVLLFGKHVPIFVLHATDPTFFLFPVFDWKKRLYDNRDDFNFLIVNCPFICSNIPAAHAYGDTKGVIKS